MNNWGKSSINGGLSIATFDYYRVQQISTHTQSPKSGLYDFVFIGTIYPFSIEELFAQVNTYPCLVKLRPLFTGLNKKLRHYEFLTANLLVSRHSSLRSVFSRLGYPKNIGNWKPVGLGWKAFFIKAKISSWNDKPICEPWCWNIYQH